MYHAVFILPNSGDSWETSSPFSTLLGAGKLGFCFANQITSSLSQYTLITSKLLDVSDIDKSVNIFTGSKSSVTGGIDIKGIGGVAESSDFSFTIEKTGVDFTKLLGRQVKITLDYTNANIKDVGESGVNTVFTGKIRRVKPGKTNVEISCSGLLATLKEKEIGTVTNYDSELYAGKIIPIIYGDFTDDNAMIPSVLNKNLKDVPDIIFGDKPLDDITDIFVYNEAGKQAIKVNDVSSLTINVDKNKIDLAVDSGITSLAGESDSNTSISIVDFPTVAFELPSNPTLNTSSFYYIAGADGYQFLRKEDGLYIFSYFATPQSARSGTLTKISGTGPATIAYSFRSDPIDPILVLEQAGQTSTTSHPITPSDNAILNVKAKPLVIKMDDEYMLVTNSTKVSSTVGGKNIYFYTSLAVERGYYDTIAAAHVLGSKIYSINGTAESVYWPIKYKIYPSDVSNLYPQFNTGKISLYNESYKELLCFSRQGSENMHLCSWSADPTAQPSLCDSSFFVDLIFPQISLKGIITDAFILGFYQVKSTGYISGTNSISSISMVFGGQSVVSGRIWNLDEPDVPVALTRGAGAGRLAKKLTTSKYNYLLQGSDNKTYSVLAYSCSLGNSVREYFNNNSNLLSLAINAEEDSYSLRNKIENYESNYYRDTPLGDISSFNDLRLALKLFYRSSKANVTDATVYFEVANPGLLLNMQISPIENKVYARGIGRYSLFTPQEILGNLLYNELNFSNAVNNTLARADWKQSVAIYDSKKKFSEVAQSICEQGGLILSDSNEGMLSIRDITPPTDTSSLTAIDKILEEDNVPAIEEEYTSIDNLITDLTLKYQYNIASEAYPLLLQSTNIPSIETYLDEASKILGETQKATVELPSVRDSVTANYLAVLLAKYNTTPLKIITMRVPFNQHNIELGQWVTCNDASLPVGKVYLVIGHNINFESGITLKLIEMPDDSTLFDTPDSNNIYIDTPDSTNIILGA